MMNPLNAVKDFALNKIEKTDAVTLGKTVAGALAIAGGIAIIVMGKVDADDILEPVVEATAPEATNVEAVVEKVVDVATDAVEAATE